MTAAARSGVATHVAYGLLAIALLTAMDALVKAVSGPLTAVQILWLRFTGTAVLAALATVVIGAAWPRRTALPAHALRAVLMAGSNGAFFHALGRLPLADVFALSFTAPLLIAVFGAGLLGERLSARTLAAIGVAFVGVIVVTIPMTAADDAVTRPIDGLVAGCLAPIIYALGIVLLRRQATGETPLQIVLAQSSMVALLLLPVLALTGWPMPTGQSLPLIAAIAVLSLAGYLTIVRALAGLTAVRYSVIEYTGLLWAAAIGYAAFAEVPSRWMWLGAALIVGAALVALTERDKAERGVTDRDVTERAKAAREPANP